MMMHRGTTIDDVLDALPECPDELSAARYDYLWALVPYAAVEVRGMVTDFSVGISTVDGDDAELLVQGEVAALSPEDAFIARHASMALRAALAPELRVRNDSLREVHPRFYAQLSFESNDLTLLPAAVRQTAQSFAGLLASLGLVLAFEHYVALQTVAGE
ncbi:hypothetical protein ACFUMH_04095 [Cellulomonas sp. NPDC057328]|uniref:hypothetical protein n=1 Tax=Cellulomonas sp. NPDC057328 TaxID=3346101 RepID=UPI00363EE43B